MWFCCLEDMNYAEITWIKVNFGVTIWMYMLCVLIFEILIGNLCFKLEYHVLGSWENTRKVMELEFWVFDGLTFCFGLKMEDFRLSMLDLLRFEQKKFEFFVWKIWIVQESRGSKWNLVLLFECVRFGKE